MKKILLSLLLVVFSYVTAMAQSEFESKLRSDGKIYVVVAVLLVILLGLFGYLISLDLKLRKLEKESQS